MLSRRHKILLTYHNGSVTLTCSCGEVLGKIPNNGDVDTEHDADQLAQEHRIKALKQAADSRSGRVGRKA